MPSEKIIRAIDEIAEESGLKETTIGLRACGDALLYERAQKRKVQDETRLAKLRKYQLSLKSENEAEV